MSEYIFFAAGALFADGVCNLCRKPSGFGLILAGIALFCGALAQ